ncbi:MAG: hypothetical protein HFJ45_00995 [Clostridia bacterium]|nr:hypothetical protein [Clostridia bacterium]
MTIIFTENDELNEELEKNIADSRVAFYTKYLLEEKDADIVILSVQNNKFEFEKFLYELRKRNIRVILLLENEKVKEVEIALRLGIYDFIFGSFEINDITKLIKEKSKFSDVARLYKKIYKIKEDAD